MNKSVSVHELRQLIENGSVVLVDVLLPEEFALRHIPSARNVCIYEMGFLDRVTECVPDRESAVVVYDASGSTLTARTAIEKLERAGYRNVAVLEGGLHAWHAAGYPVEPVGEISEAPAPGDGVYRVDEKTSVVEWSGRNINSRHYGRIAITEGEIVLENGWPVSGRFVLDMRSLSNQDIQDASWRDMLLRHLKSDDFLDVERYPTALFELRGSAAISTCTPGTPNREIAGSLTIKETSRPLCFPAIVAIQEDGSIKAQATVHFDRTLWNVCYGSGKLYEKLGMHLVNDMVSVELFIVARIPGIAAC